MSQKSDFMLSKLSVRFGAQSLTELWMYLESIRLTKILPCLAEPGKIIVIGDPSRKLDEVLPYLATLPNVISYNPDSLHTYPATAAWFYLAVFRKSIYHQGQGY